MRRNNLIISAVLAVLAVAIIISARAFPTLAGLSVGPGLFPMVLGSALLLCSAILGIQSWHALPAKIARSDEPEISPHPQAKLRFAAVLGACALFAGLGSTLGFVIVGIVSITGLMLAFGVSVKRSVIVSVTTVILLNLFFVKVMRIPLPLGVLTPFGGWL